jgi:hypothetical protein
MNSRTFTAGWLVSAAVLSSWAVSSASEQPRPVSARVEPAHARALPVLAVEVDAEIARLTAGIVATAPKTHVVRDPFKFARATHHAPVRAVVAPVPAEPDVAATAPPEAAKPLLPTLSGVAELTAGTFTAVVSFGGELHYVRKGDVIAGRYRVDSVALDGADIFDLTLGTISRLKLQA